MRKYDPALIDGYIKHLAETAKNSSCVATEDIYNEFGVLLIKKGEPITSQLSQRLGNHRLTKNVDEVMALESCLTAKSLLDTFLDYFAHQSNLLSCHDRNNFEQALEHLCELQRRHQTLLQKLTVLKHRFPDEFEEAVFCAWFSALLSRNAQHGGETMAAAFTAGLYSNLGILHIPEDRLQDTEAWQTHPIISSLIAKATQLHDKACCLATAEHHEELYGEGYPAGKNVHTLSDAGLSLATATTVYRMATLLPEGNAMNLKIALPYMRTHNAMNANPIFSGALKAIMNSQLPPLSAGLDIDPNSYNDYLLHKTLMVCELNASLNLIFQSIQQPQLKDLLEWIGPELQRAIGILHASGLSTLEVVEMLCEDEDNLISLDEMIEFDLAQAEFVFAVEYLNNQLSELLKNHKLATAEQTLYEEQQQLIEQSLQQLPDKTYFHKLSAYSAAAA